jgi:hypothetical protein
MIRPYTGKWSSRYWRRRSEEWCPQTKRLATKFWTTMAPATWCPALEETRAVANRRIRRARATKVEGSVMVVMVAFRASTSKDQTGPELGE